MDNTTTFILSEDALQRARHRMLVIEISMPILFVAFFLLSPLTEGSDGLAVGIGIAMLVIIEAILLIESTIFFRKMKEITLTISPEGVERTGGRFTEKIPFSDMRKAFITEYPSGQVASIKVDLGDKKTITLQGFEKMDWIAQQIEAAIPDKSMLKRKRLSVDWDNPWLLVVVLMLTLLVILLIQGLGMGIYQIVNILFLAVYGLITLVYRPISRSLGKRFERFEIILGAFMLLGGALIVIGMLAS